MNTSSPRWDRLDALRGVAIVWMAVFHFAFDLQFFGLFAEPQNFYRDPFWTRQRVCIVSLFLFCAGVGQALALHSGQGWPRFWKRWAQVAGCALLVTAGSALMFPKSFITFGVLHGIALMLLLLRLLAPWPGAVLLVLAAGSIVLPQLFRHEIFNPAWLNWVGLVTRDPITEDWVPVFPWLGVMLAGLVAGRWLASRASPLLQGAVPRPLRPLVTLGQWPLSFYMLHQPVFIGALAAGRWLGWW